MGALARGRNAKASFSPLSTGLLAKKPHLRAIDAGLLAR
jgi:hypothetical protein